MKDFYPKCAVKLIGAVVKLAIRDYVDFKKKPIKYTATGKIPDKYRHFMSARSFLFTGDKLEEFLIRYKIHISATFIRRIVKRIVEEEKWDWESRADLFFKEEDIELDEQEGQSSDTEEASTTLLQSRLADKFRPKHRSQGKNNHSNTKP